MSTQTCVYHSFGKCQGRVRHYGGGGPKCEVHKPPPTPVPDPRRDLRALQLRAFVARAHPPADLVERQHLEDCAIANIRHQPVPTRDESAAKVIRRLEATNQGERQDSIALRDLAMDQVEKASPQEWRDQARRAIWHLACTQATFTPDDIWFTLEARKVPPPPDPRALGPLLFRAIRSKAIEDTGTMVPSRRRHHTKITVYRKGQP